ncbi:MAG: SPOR domain-containing protein [Marinilabiliales bacterium]|nr:SPOR domain-containing protein [Marinilabiliales bacterium]
MTITEDYFAVQFGAFRTKVYAEIMKNKVEGALDKNVELFEEDGFWKVRITGFDDREDLEKYIPIIHGQGITEIWVISNKAIKGEWITISREDSLALVRETVRADSIALAGEAATEAPIPVVIARHHRSARSLQQPGRDGSYERQAPCRCRETYHHKERGRPVQGPDIRFCRYQ